MSHPVSLMIKPASGLCNMRCDYCFYHDVAANREVNNKGLMSVELLEETLNKAFNYADGQPVRISFQGGEPLMRGKDFFYAYERLVKKLNLRGSKVYVGIQTNGTLIDDEWCDFFLRNDVLVGLSLDGTEKVNSYRKFADGSPTFSTVIKSAELLEKRGVEFNILSVLTSAVADNIEEVYEFFTSRGYKHLQFIPCLKPLYDKSDNGFTPDGETYSRFLKKCFTLYTRDYLRGDYTSVRLFDNMVALAHLRRSEQCGTGGHCTHQYVIEGNGDVYPCDFYCLDEYKLGNIAETDFETMEHSEKAVRFITESLIIEDKCKACKWFALCKNGCKRERADIDKCAAYKEFFEKALPHLIRMN